ncbi:MAG: undecaprenyldiphospho-muramoylpentapeptide beta-N-acetylglucosaminyltransferase [Candidatus Cyclobacteriaceae bacterium M3_2C_046]
MNNRIIAQIRPYRLIISGGGTGGHIYPAIAIADKFREKFPEAEILFVGARGRMEMEKVPESGYPIKGLWISGLQRKISLDNLSFPFKVLSSLQKAGKIIRDFKPDAAVGVGGYASGPLLFVASRRGIPSLIQEQNSYPGITNKLLAGRASKICVAHDHMDRFFPADKIIFTGNPVRKDIADLPAKRARALEFFKFSEDKKVLLIIGGSLGARTLNQSLEAHFSTLVDQDIQVIWQTGRYYFRDYQEKMKNHDLSQVRLLEFLREMDLAYAAADVVISRAGALSVSELCLAAKPTIFVPSPNVAEDHQTKNALALEQKGAAWIVKDKEAPQILVDQAIKLLNDENEQQQLSRQIAQLARPKAAEEIVNEIVKILK